MKAFIESSTWQGSKDGYYFGTGDKGTGYYLDSAKAGDGNVENDEHPAKRARRVVRIAEDQNTMRTIPPTGEALLETAEKEQPKSIVLDLTSSSVVPNAISALQKAVAHNEVQRGQYPDDPAKYMDSEVSLYEHIQSLKAFAVNPATYFPELVTDLSSTILPLLLHDNADVVESVVALLLEWLDPTLLDAEDDEMALPTARSILQIAAVVLQEGAEFIIGNLSRYGIDDEGDEEDDDQVGKGWQDILSLVENLVEIESNVQLEFPNEFENNILPSLTSASPSNSEKTTNLSVAAKLAQETSLVSWLFRQIDMVLNEDNNDDRKNILQPRADRSLELLSLLASKEDLYSIFPDWSQLPPATQQKRNVHDLRDVSENGQKSKTIDAIELLLLIVAQYKKKQPSSDVDVDRLENASIVMTAALLYSADNVKAFLAAQGIELVMRCCKEQTHAGGVTLKWLDFSCQDHKTNQTAYEHLVTKAGALKYIFPIFMGRHLPKQYQAITNGNSSTLSKKTQLARKKARKEWQHAIETTVIRILYGLTRYLHVDSPDDAKERLLAKFVGSRIEEENGKSDSETGYDYSKCDRLVDLILNYDQKARFAEYKFFRSDVEESLLEQENSRKEQDKEAMVQLAAFDAKLAGGGDMLHRLAAIAGFCCGGSKRCHERILGQLQDKNAGISLLRESLEQFSALVEDGSQQQRQLQQYLDQI